MIIRTIRKSDAEQFLNLCKQLDAETQFMLLSLVKEKPRWRNSEIKLTIF